MSAMFPPIDEDHEATGTQNDGGSGAADAFVSSLGIDLPDGITAEDFQQFLLQSYLLNTGRKKLAHINTIQQVIDLIDKSSNILVLTGAGISVSAGIPDFRSENGLYATLKDKFNLNDPTTMFDMNYFLKDPSLFYSFGGDICPGFDDEKIKYYPTPTHYFIKLLESKGKLLRNYTQNIDTLEIRAGINNVITCHGSYVSASCINCQFQVRGVDIEKHIFNEQIPYCPYCCPHKSDLMHLTSAKDAALRAHKDIVNWNQTCHILQIRLPKILCSMNYIQKACPVLFSFNQNVLQKAMFDDDEMNEIRKETTDINMNFKTLVLKSSSNDILQICCDCIMQWLRNDIQSFGVMKPDIVFFSEALATDYHNTLEQDIKECDLLLVLGTSLQVQPVSSIPKKVPSEVPAVLINREVVGYPNDFDVNLLGNCDDVVVTLIHELKWEFMKPVVRKKKQKEAEQKRNDDEQQQTFSVKPLDTIQVETKPFEYKFVEPNYYLFPNGKLPENMPATQETDLENIE